MVCCGLFVEVQYLLFVVVVKKLENFVVVVGGFNWCLLDHFVQVVVYGIVKFGFVDGGTFYY